VQTEPGMWEWKLPFLIPPLNLNKRYRHVQQRNREYARARDDMRWTVKAQRIPAFPADPLVVPRIAVELHYFPARRGRRDPVNISLTLKALEDAIVLEGVVPDDTPAWVLPSLPLIHDPIPGRAGCWCRLVDLKVAARSPALPVQPAPR
jgi:crossover junction endodeoxyribonuclease RusA